MDRADTRAREKRYWKLGNHRQINRDAVALLDTELLEHVGKLVDLTPQIAVGENFLVTRLALKNNGGLVLCRGTHITVEAVVRHVGLSAFEPFVEWSLILVEDLVPFLVPMKIFCNSSPEPFGVIDALVEHLLVFFH